MTASKCGKRDVNRVAILQCVKSMYVVTLEKLLWRGNVLLAL
ncbi:hypothetical protein HMPREF3208_00345 [Gardnerella vaginalis]|uniref:Uncharacterized protein n=1 Tax=Gardnerella vaginalis TaxID=2702 RepID=A0A133P184_GARVA|nr:hypothetical protein HMPREF3208_00345 [Gardnerella vaginalis]